MDDSRARPDTDLLVVRCQLGEPEAFDALVDRWHTPLWRFVRRMVNDDGAAEEVVQDVWLRILRGIDRLRDSSRLAPWMFSIARRAVMDHLRREYADSAVVAMDEEPAGDAHREIDWNEIGLLQQSVAELPPRERETLALFYIRELDLSEVAAVLEIPVGTVKSRLHRARGLLRERLEAKGVTR